MTDRAEIASRLVREKAVLDLLTEHARETRAEATGVYAPGAADPVGDLGRVRMDKGRAAVRVVDERALLIWMEEHCPHEIVTTHAPNSAWVRALDGAAWVDPTTGEVLDVPGVEMVPGSPRLVVTTSDEGRAWAIDALTGAGVLALESNPREMR